MDWGGWAEQEVPPLTDADAPPPDYLAEEPEVRTWELTEEESRIYGAGHLVGYASRDAEVAALHARIDQLNHEADRLYHEAYVRRVPKRR